MAMLIQFNEEQKMVRDMVREFTKKEVEPRDYYMDQNDAFDRELYAKFNELGLSGVLVPEEYGGMGLSRVDVAALFVLLRQVLWILAAAVLAFALLSLLLDRGKANPSQDAAPKRFPHPGQSPSPVAPAGSHAAACSAPAGGRALRAWGKALVGGAALFLGLAGLLALICALDFNRAFIAFHHLFFTNDLWLLDPRTDLLIRICPQSMFMGMAVRIGALEDALRRMDVEDYGICEDCGERIPLRRLLAAPAVRLCVACQEEADKDQRAVSLYNRRGSKDSQLR